MASDLFVPRVKASSESTRMLTWKPSTGSGRPALYLATVRSQERSIFEPSAVSSCLVPFFLRKRPEVVVSLKEV